MTNRPNPPQHAVLRKLQASPGPFLWAGKSLEALAVQAGQTPFYAYDSARMQSTVAQLRETLPPSIQLHYAMKANPLPAVVTLMASLVDGIDVASGGELQSALAAGAPSVFVTFPRSTLPGFISRRTSAASSTRMT